MAARTSPEFADAGETECCLVNLRNYQSKMLDDARNALASSNRVLCVLPTGAGKTVVFSEIVKRAAGLGKSAWIVVHRQELLRQAAAKLSATGVPFGLITAGMEQQPGLVQVATIGTLARRLDRFKAPDLIILDEAHHAVAGGWQKLLAHANDSKVLGFTATPERLDGKGLGSVFEAMILGPSVGQLQADGFLSPATYFGIPPRADFSGLRKTGGDFNKADLASVTDRPTITGDAVTHWKRHANGLPTIGFCVTVAHAEHCAAQFNEAGIAAASIDGNLDSSTRKQRLDDLASGKIKVLFSCELVSEGFDLPCVSAAILLRKTASLSLHLQQIGRVLRPASDKARAIILDHVGNVTAHGMACDERQWSLDGQTEKKRNSLEKNDICDFATRQCPKCYALHKRAPKCPECQHIYEAGAREIAIVAGELVELSGANFKRCPVCQQTIHATHEQCPACEFDFAKAARREVVQARTLEDLMALGQRRGYKNAYFWAQRILQARGAKAQAY